MKTKRLTNAADVVHAIRVRLRYAPLKFNQIKWSLLFAIALLSPFGVALAPAYAATSNQVTDYYQQSGNNAYVKIPVTNGDVIQVWGQWWQGGGGNQCGSGGDSGHIGWNQGSGTSTVQTVNLYLGSGNPQVCNTTAFIEEKATTTATWSFDVVNDGGFNTMTILANQLNSTTSGNGGGGTTNNYFPSLATTSQNALVVDNPNGDLATGLFLMLMVAGGVIWVFKKR